jgi:protein-tyrosine sulfotransferase
MNEPIFIMSEIRSGSTLLRVLLDTHPAICSPGELSLGLLCEHLFHAIATTLGQVVYQQSAEARTELCLAETRRIVDGILQTYCALKGKRRWCEKSPGNLRLAAKLRAVFPDGRYICLYRHCLDVVHSATELYVDAWPEIQEYRDKYGDRPLPAFIERWCDRTDDLLAFEAATAGTSQRVRYEDLVADPAGNLQRLLAFLGEEWRPDLIERAFASPHDHGVGDPKIAGTSTVRGDRVGAGRQFDLSSVPSALLDRMRRILALLGYNEQPEVAAPAPPPSRPVYTTVAALVDELFRQRLERHRLWLRAPRLDLGLIVRGAGGGAWTLQFDPSGASLSPAAGTSPVTIAIESADLLDAANGRLTLGELRTKIAMEGAALEYPLFERLVHVLFGDGLHA